MFSINVVNIIGMPRERGDVEGSEALPPSRSTIKRAARPQQEGERYMASSHHGDLALAGTPSLRRRTFSASTARIKRRMLWREGSSDGGGSGEGRAGGGTGAGSHGESSHTGGSTSRTHSGEAATPPTEEDRRLARRLVIASAAVADWNVCEHAFEMLRNPNLGTSEAINRQARRFGRSHNVNEILRSNAGHNLERQVAHRLEQIGRSGADERQEPLTFEYVRHLALIDAFRHQAGGAAVASLGESTYFHLEQPFRHELQQHLNERVHTMSQQGLLVHMQDLEPAQQQQQQPQHVPAQESGHDALRIEGPRQESQPLQQQRESTQLGESQLGKRPGLSRKTSAGPPHETISEASYETASGSDMQDRPTVLGTTMPIKRIRKKKDRKG